MRSSLQDWPQINDFTKAVILLIAKSFEFYSDKRRAVSVGRLSLSLPFDCIPDAPCNKVIYDVFPVRCIACMMLSVYSTTYTDKMEATLELIPSASMLGELAEMKYTAARPRSRRRVNVRSQSWILSHRIAICKLYDDNMKTVTTVATTSSGDFVRHWYHAWQCASIGHRRRRQIKWTLRKGSLNHKLQRNRKHERPTMSILTGILYSCRDHCWCWVCWSWLGCEGGTSVIWYKGCLRFHNHHNVLICLWCGIWHCANGIYT